MTTNFIPGTPSGCERIAYAVGFQENATYSDVYGGGGAVVVTRHWDGLLPRG